LTRGKQKIIDIQTKKHENPSVFLTDGSLRDSSLYRLI